MLTINKKFLIFKLIDQIYFSNTNSYNLANLLYFLIL